MDNATNYNLSHIEFTNNSFANTFSFILEAYPKGDAFKLIKYFDKATVLDIYKMTGQLRMTEEEKKAKMKVKYDQEVDEIQAKLQSKGLSFMELARQYGTEVQLGQ